MSLRIYHTATELTGSDIDKRKFARFILIIGYRPVANGKPRMKRCEFGVAGTTDAAVLACGVNIAEILIESCAGEVMAFYQNLGHYRKDKPLPVIAPNRRVWGLLKHSPDPATLEAVNCRMFIPFWNGSVSDFGAIRASGSFAGGTAGLGYARWTDQNQTELEAMFAGTDLGGTIVDETKIFNEHLVTDNTADGIADGVLDEQV